MKQTRKKTNTQKTCTISDGPTETFPRPKHKDNIFAVLPSRSALSNLGLIAYLFTKNAPKLVLCLPKKLYFLAKKVQKVRFSIFQPST